jgi:hypothetical protein
MWSLHLKGSSMTDNVNLCEWIEQAAGDAPILRILIEDNEAAADIIPGYATQPRGRELSWEAARPHLDYTFDADAPVPSCNPVRFWTRRHAFRIDMQPNILGQIPMLYQNVIPRIRTLFVVEDNWDRDAIGMYYSTLVDRGHDVRVLFVRELWDHPFPRLHECSLVIFFSLMTSGAAYLLGCTEQWQPQVVVIGDCPQALRAVPGVEYHQRFSDVQL